MNVFFNCFFIQCSDIKLEAIWSNQRLIFQFFNYLFIPSLNLPNFCYYIGKIFQYWWTIGLGWFFLCENLVNYFITHIEIIFIIQFPFNTSWKSCLYTLRSMMEYDGNWPDVLGTGEFWLNRPATKLYLEADIASAWSLTISPTVRSISLLTGHHLSRA